MKAIPLGSQVATQIPDLGNDNSNGNSFLLTAFLLLQLTVDCKSDNMATAMNKRKVLCVEGNILKRYDK